jgi:superfamily I DNA and/or RNA helicase
LDHRPIWAISNLSAHNRIPLFPAIFDYVVFDEASQSDIASALPLFARAKSAIIVGDPQQLRFIPELSKATEHALMDAADLPREGRYIFAQSVNSLFDFCAHLPTSKRFFLKDQFRSSPDLVHYLSDEFYPGKGLEGRKEDDKFKLPKSYKPGLTWTNVIGQTTRQDGGNINVPEAEQAIVELQKILKDETFKGSVGIISPFNAQVNLIQKLAKKKLSEAEWSRLTLRISTIDKFQGGEADLIIFSLVAAIGSERNALAFLNREKRRINVAVSRARALCIIIGDVEFARRSGVNHLVRLAHRATQKNERVRPPFDSMWERRMDAAMTTRGIETFPQYSVGTRYLDFAVDPDGKKINVEVDGRIWHTDIDGNRKISDRMRDIELTARGWTVLRFWVHELEQDMESCLDRIEFALKQ